MTLNKRENLLKMKDISIEKKEYGINQIKVEFSSKSKLSNDANAVHGKRILREKIFSKT